MSRKGKRPTPPFMMRRVAIFVGAQAAMSMIGFLPLLHFAPAGTAWLFSLQGCMVLGQAVFTWWFVSGHVRLRRKIEAVGGRACWGCGYLLEGLADDGTCPECGRQYRLAELRERWQVGQGGRGGA